MTLIDFLFWKLGTPKTQSDKCLKSDLFRGCFEKQYGKPAQTLMNFALQHLYHIHLSLPCQLSWKKSFLLTCKILRLLVNTLAADENYLVLHRDNLKIPIQMQLPQKQKFFSQFFAAFLKSRLNFKHFENKDDPHRFFILEVRVSKNLVR